MVVCISWEIPQSVFHDKYSISTSHPQWVKFNLFVHNVNYAPNNLKILQLSAKNFAIKLEEDFIYHKIGLQPDSSPVKQVHYFGGGEMVLSPIGAKDL